MRVRGRSGLDQRGFEKECVRRKRPGRARALRAVLMMVVIMLDGDGLLDSKSGFFGVEV